MLRRLAILRISLSVALVWGWWMVSYPVLAKEAAMRDVYGFSFTGIDGTSAIPLKQYEGKAILLVNTASRCGFTSQYKGLEALWQRYRARGLVVIGVPSNDFGAQEPGTGEEIQRFCEMNYGVSFPLTEKASVSGKSAHPFYQYARDTLGWVAAPKWNFHKYLVNADGELVEWFASTTGPESEKLVRAIEKALPPEEKPAND